MSEIARGEKIIIKEKNETKLFVIRKHFCRCKTRFYFFFLSYKTHRDRAIDFRYRICVAAVQNPTLTRMEFT